MLSKVRVADTVVQSCLTHALTTEQEEVMGLLLGQISTTSSASLFPEVGFNCKTNRDGFPCSDAAENVADVWDLWVVQRSVRRSDRVEIAPERLADASEEAERCTATVKTPTRVIGWYHSHPRITPYPSQVDLNSQLTYQSLESGWVGLIFSVFYKDPSEKSAVSIHCFQTGPDCSHKMVEVEVVPITQMPLRSLPNCDATCQLLRVFQAEVEAAIELVKQRCHEAPNAMKTAYALRDVQLFSLEKLVLQPALRCLNISISELEKKVAKLEKAPASPVVNDLWST
uniref:Putative metallopeptidase n=1 Tax=Trypanosoma vivax (strain Y486) TaxID=1055687 RepID=G0U3W2_TRYVY|nr:putative metallopeptidase [Trypanosoma vivax Y486]